MNQPWYVNGLAFECTRCGKCCGGEPGFVWVNESELEEIAQFLQIDLEKVKREWTRLVQGRTSLTEKENYECIFYETGKGCTIYPVRPRQCRTWPFWSSNLKTPKEWERTLGLCPGAGQGELIPVEEITRKLRLIHM